MILHETKSAAGFNYRMTGEPLAPAFLQMLIETIQAVNLPPGQLKIFRLAIEHSLRHSNLDEAERNEMRTAAGIISENYSVQLAQ